MKTHEILSTIIGGGFATNPRRQRKCWFIEVCLVGFSFKGEGGGIFILAELLHTLGKKSRTSLPII